MKTDALRWQAIREANRRVPGGEQPAWSHAYWDALGGRVLHSLGVELLPWQRRLAGGIFAVHQRERVSAHFTVDREGRIHRNA